jgi:CheY-like chemotaxis protein
LASHHHWQRRGDLKVNILLTEDNPVNRVLAQKLLQKQGHTVTSANNGKEAVDLWEAQSIPAIRHRFDGRSDAGDGRPAGNRLHSRKRKAIGHAHSDRGHAPLQ